MKFYLTEVKKEEDEPVPEGGEEGEGEVEEVDQEGNVLTAEQKEQRAHEL